MADRAPLVAVSGSFQQIQSGDYIANAWVNWGSPGAIGTGTASSGTFTYVDLDASSASGGGIAGAGAGKMALRAGGYIQVEVEGGASDGTWRVRLGGSSGGAACVVGSTGRNLSLQPYSGLLEVSGSTYSSGPIGAEELAVSAYRNASGVWTHGETTTVLRIAPNY